YKKKHITCQKNDDCNHSSIKQTICSNLNNCCITCNKQSGQCEKCTTNNNNGNKSSDDNKNDDNDDYCDSNSDCSCSFIDGGDCCAVCYNKTCIKGQLSYNGTCNITIPQNQNNTIDYFHFGDPTNPEEKKDVMEEAEDIINELQNSGGK